MGGVGSNQYQSKPGGKRKQHRFGFMNKRGPGSERPALAAEIKSYRRPGHKMSNANIRKMFGMKR